ncbi:MAG: hypothetical protein ABL936_04715 [Aestuariivirga sp.]
MHKHYSSIIFIILALLFCNVANADDAAIKKYRDYLPEQIKELPEAVQKSELPIMYGQAASTGLSPWAKDLFSLQLNKLLYNGLGDYEGAVQSYQKDLGDQPTGKLTVWQIFQLNYRSELQSVSPPSLLHNFISGKTPGSAFVFGTMTIVDERPAWPINSVKLNCFKDEGYCRLDELDVQPPTENDWTYNYSIFWTDSLYYKIIRWSEDVVQAEFESSGNACRTTTMDLNFKTKEFYLITKNSGEVCEVLGQKMEQLRKPRISQIVDGEKIIAAELQSFKKKSYLMLSSEFRARVEKYQKVGESE